MCEDDRCELGKRKGAVEMNHDGNDGWRNEIWGPAPTYMERLALPDVNSRDNVGMIVEDQSDANGLKTIDPRVADFRHRHREGQRLYMIAPKLYGGHHADHTTATARAIAAALAAAQVHTGS